MTDASDFRVTLLGTGVPIPSPERFGPSTLIEAGDQKLLIDAGRGATIRLYQLKVPIGRIDALLLTHYHSDHTCGIPDVWLTGWLEFAFRHPQDTVPCHRSDRRGGPDVAISQHAYAADIKISRCGRKTAARRASRSP